ncbi:TPA: DUF4762 family protein [Salmonella enterica]|nr:DUF4762 family protein [Salmonella enterica]HCL4433057.1 DUF4762 family protein [Salmonella enterica]HCL5080912.1 DUF4762 family protein [Salmonella enterica]HCL5332018.1 DUF4762 family protein [Salmonella enterica]
MKRITIDQAAGIVGGDDCEYVDAHIEHRSNGTSACVATYVCYDKHGEQTSARQEDMGYYYCPGAW